jgi:hypothetical protein
MFPRLERFDVEFDLGDDAVETELSRLRHSFEETLAELEQHAGRIEGEFDAALAGIFLAHGEMLRSLLASGELEREPPSSRSSNAAFWWPSTCCRRTSCCCPGPAWRPWSWKRSDRARTRRCWPAKRESRLSRAFQAS